MGYKHDDACLAKVGEHEPIFVLRAQDKLAPMLVRLWADLAELHGAPGSKTIDVDRCAMEMESWATRHGSKWPD